ncbi:unnamed protein product [Discosporangium mesarthrocarpum]
MDPVVGPSVKGYLSSDTFADHHMKSKEHALHVFDAMATMGRKEDISTLRVLLVDDITREQGRYAVLNAGKNPFQGMELWAIPMTIAVISYIARWIADMSCSSWSDTCRSASHKLGFLYCSMVVFLLVVFREKTKAFLLHLQTLLPILVGAAQEKVKAASS